MSIRNFSNNAVQASLAVSCTDTAVAITVTSVTGWPSAPFTILLDPDEILEEVCLVTAVAGTTLTVTRGYGGTSAVAHTAGAVVKHGAVAQDFIEANAHVNATSGVHGVTGPLVSTSGTQTLTNKTIDYLSNTLLNLPPGPTGPMGPAGPAGANGTNGTNGTNGADGVGVPAGGTTGQVLSKASNTSYDTVWSAAASGLPSQTGNSGKFLTTDGSAASWAVVNALPSQTGNTGKYLTTDGTTASWATVSGGSAGDSDQVILAGRMFG